MCAQVKWITKCTRQQKQRSCTCIYLSGLNFMGWFQCFESWCNLQTLNKITVSTGISYSAMKIRIHVNIARLNIQIDYMYYIVPLLYFIYTKVAHVLLSVFAWILFVLYINVSKKPKGIISISQLSHWYNLVPAREHC